MVLIYTDLLLDDLCALEVLGKWCKSQNKKAMLVGTCLDELHNSVYGSPHVRNLTQARTYLDKWFGKYELVSEKSKRYRYNPEMIIVICSVTAFYRDLTNWLIFNDRVNFFDAYKTGQFVRPIYIMGGSSKAKDGIGTEYNASADKQAFTELLKSRWVQYYFNETCLKLFDKYGYETKALNFKPEFLDEYLTTMSKLGENLYCPDLMVANDLVMHNGTHSQTVGKVV